MADLLRAAVGAAVTTLLLMLAISPARSAGPSSEHLEQLRYRATSALATLGHAAREGAGDLDGAGARALLREALDAYIAAAELGLDSGDVLYTREISELAGELSDPAPFTTLFPRLLEASALEHTLYDTRVDLAGGLARLADPAADTHFRDAILMREPVDALAAHMKYARVLIRRGRHKEALAVLDRFDAQLSAVPSAAFLQQRLVRELGLGTGEIDAETAQLHERWESSLQRSIAPAAPGPRTAQPQDVVIGLLSLPEVLGLQADGTHGKPEIALHAAPDAASAVSIARTSELQTELYNYDESGVLVLEQRGRWFRVRLAEGSGWIKASERHELFSLETLLDRDESYVDVASDGWLAPTPGDVADEAAAGWDRVLPQQTVHVSGFRHLGEQLWVQVDVLSHSTMESLDLREEVQVLARGWMRAHGASGEPAIWFSGKGC